MEKTEAVSTEFPAVREIEAVTPPMLMALVKAVGGPIAAMVCGLPEADLSKGRGVLEGTTRCLWTKDGRRITISLVAGGGLIASCSRNADPAAV